VSIDISIVIPTYKRRDRLRECLGSVFRQDYQPDKFEVVVVDDNSDYETERLLRGFKKTYPKLRFLAQNHKGPAAARNLGSKVSQGEIIGFVDDDCTVSADWVKLMVQEHREHPQIAAVGGATSLPGNKTSILVSQFLSTHSIETVINGKKEVIFFPTCNVSFKKRILDKYQFNEKFPLPGGEDLELFWRIFSSKERFIWKKNIQVTHYRQDSLGSFIRQAYSYGRGNFLTRHLHNNHPLLKELKTGKISFWTAALINILKIPRFSFLLGNMLIEEGGIRSISKKLSVYAYFTLHKIFYIVGNIAEFLGIKQGRLHKNLGYYIPELLIFDVTHACNLNCRICDIWKTSGSEANIDIGYVKKILSQAKGMNIREIALSGGETLLRKDVFDIFEYARQIKIKDLGVLTNGILIGNFIDRLNPYLKDNTVSLVISLDSLKPEAHNNIRNSENAWEKTVENLKMLSALKKEYPQINVNVITIILNSNLEELPDVAEFIKSLGVNSLQFQPFLPSNLRMAERKRSVFWVSDDRLPLLDKTIDKLIEFKSENSHFVKNSVKNLAGIKKYFRNKITSSEVKCCSAYKTVLISNQGECTTCFSSYGDIKRQDLNTILQSTAIIKARRMAVNCPGPCLLPCFCDR
jgi:MoaA/NifB/PqqE/SkfB family radical SAM enzyme/GT2 family glycosyltransferase